MVPLEHQRRTVSADRSDPMKRRQEVTDMERTGRASHHKNLFYLALLLPLALAAPGCLQSPLEFGGGTSGAIAANLAPDQSYTPSVGDRAVLLGTGLDAPADQAPLLADVTSFDKYERAIKSQAAAELSDMEQAGA